MSGLRSSQSYDVPTPPRSLPEASVCPYTLGAIFIAHRHQPPPPFGGFYSSYENPDQRELHNTTQLDWCLSHPAATGTAISHDTRTFTITSIVRTGEESGAQIVCIDTRYVAKIYDPVFYPFEDRELPDTRVDVAAVADSEYSIEAAAYSELEGSPVQGSIMPEYYGSWTLNVITVIQNEQITRQVRMILIEYVPGVRMLDINPEDLTPEAREYIMTKVIEADYDLRRAGVRHDDLSPRNIVLSETPDSIEPELRVTLVDFGCSTVFALRYGRPLRWGLCNPLFTWSSASAWSTWGWLPPCTEDEIAKRWKVWGSGRDGKYAAVERDANSQLGIPLRPKAKCKVQRNR